MKNRINRFVLFGLFIEQMYSQHLFSSARDITGKRISLLCENMEPLQWFWFTNLSFSVNTPTNVVGLELELFILIRIIYSFFAAR